MLLNKNIAFAIAFIFFSGSILSQNVRVKLDQLGDSRTGTNLSYQIVVTPHYSHKRKRKAYIDFSKFRGIKLEPILVHYKVNRRRKFPVKMSFEECSDLNPSYDDNEKVIEITQQNNRVKFEFFDFETSGGKPIFCTKEYSSICDTSDWLTIQKHYVKFGRFNIGNTAYSITLADKSLNGRFNDSKDAIGIQKGCEYDRFINTNARAKYQEKIEFLDFEGIYFQIMSIDSSGSYIDLRVVDSIIPSESVYIDNFVRNNEIYLDKDSVEIQDLFIDKRLVVFSVWSEYCPPCINELSKLNDMQEKYKDNLKIIGLFNGVQEDLDRLIKQYDIKIPQAILTNEIKNDLLVAGYPYKVVCSPKGEILSDFASIRSGKSLERFILETIDIKSKE